MKAMEFCMASAILVGLVVIMAAMNYALGI